MIPQLSFVPLHNWVREQEKYEYLSILYFFYNFVKM